MEVTAAEATLQNASIHPSSSTIPIQPDINPASFENGTYPNLASATMPSSSSETKCVPSDPTVQPTTSNANPNMPAHFKKPSVPLQSSPSRNAKRSSARRSSAKQTAGSGQQDRKQPASNSNAYPTNGQAACSTAEDDRSLENLCKVEVSGYPTFAKAREIFKFFTSYGDPCLEQVGKNSTVLSFRSREEANAAISDSMKVCMYGQFLTIKPFSGIEGFKKQGNKNNKNTVEIIPPHRLALTGTFEQQLGGLLAAVRLTQEEVAGLATLYADVERVLQQLWPGCQAMPFGSLTTGLGVKSSDADCFVNIPPQYRHAQTNFVARARRVLQQYPHMFAEVIGIPRANTPIVKLLHVGTRTRCDLSFKTPLGALNSRLVAFLLHADARLVPAAVLAKYWAGVHALSGTGRLTNYALTLLLLFYLQQRGLLPPVARLQGDASRLLVDGWDSGFAADPALLPRTHDPASVADLLGGFFGFYAAFDFESLVVCPYLGRPLAKGAFVEPALLPGELERYRRNVEQRAAPALRVRAPLCVQDPFEQSHNVASSVSARLAQDLRAYFAFAAAAYESERASGCTGFLRTILLEKPKTIRARSFPEYRVCLYPRQLDCIARADWRAAVREAVHTVFEQILQLELTPAGNAEKTNSKRDKEKYLTSFDKPLWKRKQFTRLYESVPMGFVEKYTRITKEVLNVEHGFPPVQLQVILSFCTKVRSVWLSIKMTDGDVEAFHPFGKYFLTAMQNLVIGTLHASGCMENQKSLKKESESAVDSNVGNNDFNNDSAADENKDINNPNPKQTEQAEILKNKENPMSTEIIESNASNSMEIDHGTVKSSSVQQTEIIESPATVKSSDESSTVCKTSMENNITSDQQTTETSAMEIEDSEVESNTYDTTATTIGLTVTERNLSDL